jgi:hypothetical protein
MADEYQAMQGNHEPSEAPDAPWLHTHYTTELDEFDIVQRPAHYNQGQFEVIDVIEDKLTPEQFRGYLEGNVLKYILRHQYKGHPKQDLQKAQWYLNRMVETFND